MGTSSTGQFSYDESLFLFPGTYAGYGLLDSVSFDWNGTTFTEANVDRGHLTFDPFLQLVGVPSATVIGHERILAPGSMRRNALRLLRPASLRAPWVKPDTLGQPGSLLTRRYR